MLAVVQDNNNHRKIQERMESQIYAQQQELAQVQKESQTLTRQRKHLEKRLENEVNKRFVYYYPSQKKKTGILL